VHREREASCTRATARRRAPVRRRAYAAGLAGAVAVIALALALVLPAGTPGGPTISQAAALATRGPAMPAPEITHQGPGTRLGDHVDELYFPDWHHTLGWRATGERIDVLGGRRAITVYYVRGAERVAYTIVATPPLPQPSARRMRAGALTVHALQIGARTVVTWRRGGDTCVLSSVGLSARALARLASWSDQPGTD
jgi:hypothetical protein